MVLVMLMGDDEAIVFVNFSIMAHLGKPVKWG